MDFFALKISVLNSRKIKNEETAFEEVLSKNLKVMDCTAASLCRDNNISVFVFSLQNPENIVKTLQGENLGTVAKP